MFQLKKTKTPKVQKHWWGNLILSFYNNSFFKNTACVTQVEILTPLCQNTSSQARFLIERSEYRSIDLDCFEPHHAIVVLIFFTCRFTIRQCKKNFGIHTSILFELQSLIFELKWKINQVSNEIYLNKLYTIV